MPTDGDWQDVAHGEAQVELPNSQSDLSRPGRGNTFFLARLEHFTWAWFCLPMATGGLALLLSSQPHTFPGLLTIGKVVFIWDLVIFSLVAIAIVYRFTRFPGTLRSSLTHPTESLFMPTCLLSCASILACTAKYGIPSSRPWLLTTFQVFFWLYFAITFLSSLFQYLLLFSSPRLKIQDMTPAWDLPIFPFMLCGTLAASVSPYFPANSSNTLPIIIAGLTAQGLGFLISILMFASYLRRMIQYGFPSPSSRPGLFISVGPPSFTALALIGLSRSFPVHHLNHFFTPAGVDPATTLSVLRLTATFSAIFIWSLSFWFFCVSLACCLAAWRKLTFHLNWWAFVFPNVGFTVATIEIGEALGSAGVTWVGSGMTLMLCAVYVFVLVMHARAVVEKKILWSGLDEDVHVNEYREKKKGGEEEEGRRQEERGENGTLIGMAERRMREDDEAN